MHACMHACINTHNFVYRAVICTTFARQPRSCHAGVGIVHLHQLLPLLCLTGLTLLFQTSLAALLQAFGCCKKPFCSFPLSTETMSRVAGIVFAASLALYGASCFILPATLPKGAPQTESGAVVGQPSAINGTPESASWSPLAAGFSFNELNLSYHNFNRGL